jgi:hypothetical protein
MRLAIPGVILLTKGLVSCLGQLETIDTVEMSNGHVYAIKDYEGDVWLTELAIEELRLWVQCIWAVRVQLSEMWWMSTHSWMHARPVGVQLWWSGSGTCQKNSSGK